MMYITSDDNRLATMIEGTLTSIIRCIASGVVTYNDDDDDDRCKLVGRTIYNWTSMVMLQWNLLIVVKLCSKSMTTLLTIW
jgi:hypothetical protein